MTQRNLWKRVGRVVVLVLLSAICGCQSGTFSNPFGSVASGLSPVPPQWEPDVTTLSSQDKM